MVLPNGTNTEELSIPGFTSKQSGMNTANYTIKFFKADIDDLTNIATLQEIETRAFRNPDDVTILERDKYTFLERMFLIIKYAEKTSGV